MTGGARRATITMLLMCIVMALALTGDPPSTATAAPVPQRQPDPDRLDRPRHGRDAIAVLGDRLPAVAARHSTTSARLRQRFEEDPSLWVDETLRLFFVEPDVEGHDLGGLVGSPEPPGEAGGAAAAPADVFALHSQLGADRVLYLDFDGHTTTGTSWNDNSQFGTGSTIVSPPYDADGNPGSFSTAEQDVVYDVWQRVAEDYAPFAVDVTTADPGVAAIDRSSSLDSHFGSRVVITWNNPIGQWCGCGGIAYVGVFNDPTSHAYYQPAFVFQAYLGGAGATGKTLAEAASHEAGHNLGLFHDGTSTSGYYLGHGAWAPIMGAGYYRPISHWSKGEYADANNPEDDFARMGLYGLPTLPDDHGDSIGAATPIGATASGRIGSATDVDVVSFTLTEAEHTTVEVSPALVGANLDVHLSLLNAAGTVVLDEDPQSSMLSIGVADGLDAVVAGTLPAGTYYVHVDGTGNGDPATTGYSDYGSVGSYEVTLTHMAATCTAAPPGIIGWWKGEGALAAEVGPNLTGTTGYGPGIVGTGLVLGGPEGLPVTGFPTLPAGVTVEAWIQPEATGFTQAVFSRYRWIGGHDDDAFALFLAGDQLLWVAGEASSMAPPSLTGGAAALYNGLFHHLAATWGDGQMALYVDGVQVATRTTRGALSTAPATELIIGGTSPRPGHALAFAGVIDEPTVYDRALAAGEVQAIFNAGAGGKCAS